MERKNVFITGGSRGIGKAIAKKFAQNGYDVIVNYVSENTNLEELEKELKNGQEEIRTLFVKGDVTDVASCTEMVKQITKEFGKLDVVINNAGITKDGLLMRMKEEDFDKLIEKGDVLVDFFATWCGPCKMLSPVLEELSDHFERVKVVKVDIDQFEDLTRRHGIMSVPTMEIYKDGKLVKKEVGYHDYDTIASWFLR